MDRVQVGGDHQGGVGVGAPAAAEVHPVHQLGELLELQQLRLGGAVTVGQAEVHLEGVVPVRVLPGQVVVVGVVPGDPAGGPGQQRVVQGLAVVVRGVGAGDEV